MIYPLHKAGELEQVKNYRGIALLNVGYKLLAGILASRLSTWIEREEIFKESQAGFRRARGTRDHVFTLNALMGKELAVKGGKVYLAFIDLRAAFDKVDRGMLEERLEELKVGARMSAMIKEIYARTRNRVITAEGLTDSFSSSKGVRQGCPLSPILFDMVIDDIDEAIRRKGLGGVTLAGKKVQILKFADDMVLVAKTVGDVQEMLNEVQKFLGKANLEINVDKSKIMICRKAGRRAKNESWVLLGKELEVVKEYKYLGVWFNSANNFNTHMSKMKEKARKASNMVWGVIKRSRVGKLSRRLKLYEGIVKSAGIYGVEIWGWEWSREIGQLQAKYVKMAMGISKNTPDYIWKMEAGRKGLGLETKMRAMRYLRELLVKEDKRWNKAALREEIRIVLNGKPTRWGRSLKKCLEQAGDGATLRMIWEKADPEIIDSRLKRILTILEDQEQQLNWVKIQSSTFNDKYKIWKTEKGREKYWEMNGLQDWERVQWARLRCGSTLREGKKGYKDTKCRLCKKEEENLKHMVWCEKLDEEVVGEAWDRWLEWRDVEGVDREQAAIEALKGTPLKVLVERARAFERLVRKDCETEGDNVAVVEEL